jgi:hypothetical protein
LDLGSCELRDAVTRIKLLDQRHFAQLKTKEPLTALVVPNIIEKLSASISPRGRALYPVEPKISRLSESAKTSGEEALDETPPI